MGRDETGKLLDILPTECARPRFDLIDDVYSRCIQRHRHTDLHGTFDDRTGKPARFAWPMPIDDVPPHPAPLLDELVGGRCLLRRVPARKVIAEVLQDADLL